jgi:hypothetical protein
MTVYPEQSLVPHVSAKENRASASPFCGERNAIENRSTPVARHWVAWLVPGQIAALPKDGRQDFIGPLEGLHREDMKSCDA